MNTEPTRKYLVTSCWTHRHQDTHCGQPTLYGENITATPGNNEKYELHGYVLDDRRGEHLAPIISNGLSIPNLQSFTVCLIFVNC